MDYHWFRQFADSWFLIAMFTFFIGAVLYAFRPDSRSGHSSAANIPFRHEDAPYNPNTTDAEARK